MARIAAMASKMAPLLHQNAALSARGSAKMIGTLQGLIALAALTIHRGQRWRSDGIASIRR
jgi:hypothetical protein